MPIKFNEAVFSESTSEWDYSSEGTLAKNAKGYKMKFTKRNLAGTNLNAKGEPTRVTIILTKGDKRFNLPCSNPLSALIRNAVKTKPQSEVLAGLMQLEIMVNNEDSSRYFLCQPQGDGEQLPEFKSEDLVAKDVAFADVMF